MKVEKGKRPRDANQPSKWIVDRSTGNPPQEVVTPTKAVVSADLSAYMAAIGRKGGQIGGKRRLKTMTPSQRSIAAKKAAGARWKKSRKLGD